MSGRPGVRLRCHSLAFIAELRKYSYSAAVEFTRAALRNNTDLTGGRTSIFRAVVRGEDLNFLHGIHIGSADAGSVRTRTNSDGAIIRDQVVLRAATVDVQSTGGEIEAELRERAAALHPASEAPRNSGLRPFKGVS